MSNVANTEPTADMETATATVETTVQKPSAQDTLLNSVYKYLSTDPVLRLANNTIYKQSHLGSTIYDVLATHKQWLENAFTMYAVKFEVEHEYIRDAHASYTHNSVRVISNIDKNTFWLETSDLLLPSDIGMFVQRRQYSKMWNQFDPFKMYRVIHLDSNLVYITNYKDSNGMYIANLDEYKTSHPGIAMTVTGPCIKPDLFICENDGGFLLV